MTAVEEIERQLAEINVKTMEERMERLEELLILFVGRHFEKIYLGGDNPYETEYKQYMNGKVSSETHNIKNIHRELVYERTKNIKLREELEQQFIEAKENEKDAEIQKKITREALKAEIRKEMMEELIGVNI
tara:strand:+ start:45 stop:440 length:396 start_codon:yes stop_codon:yes gene_type:complete